MSKIRKTGLLLMLVLCLFGCTRISNETVPELALEALEEAVEGEITTRVNINKGMLSFYLEPAVGRRESTPVSSVLLIDGNEVILNLDVSSVVTAKYYYSDVKNSEADTLRELDAFPNVVAGREGSFLSGTGIVKKYRYRLSQLTDTEYGIFLQTSNLMMAGICGTADVPDMTARMMRVLRTCRVDEEKIVTAYSQKELINYNKKVLNIFKKIYPETTELQDMIDDTTGK